LTVECIGTADPRGALRWSLSKIRTLLGDAGEFHIQADRSRLCITRDYLVDDILTAR
jgi:hypothetical protein